MAWNTINTNTEDLEKNKKQSNKKNKQIFIKDFCDKQMQDDSNKNIFLDTIFIEKILPSKSIENELTGWTSNTLKKYEWVWVDDIKLLDLRKHLWRDFLSLKFSRDNLESIIDSEYNLTDKQKKSLEINNLNTKDLNILLENKDNSLDDFLKDKLSLENLFSLEKDTFYDELSTFVTKEKLEKFSKEDIENIQTIMTRLKYNEWDWLMWEAQIEALNELLNIKWLFDNNFKKKFLYRYLPNISIWDVKKILWGLSYWKIRKKIIDDTFWDDLEEEDKKWLYSLIDNNLYKIKSSFLLDNLNNSNIDNFLNSDAIFSRKMAENFIEKYNKNITTLGDKKLDEWPSSFKWFISKLEELKIPGVEKLKEKSIFKFVIKTDKSYFENYWRLNSDNDSEKTLSMSMVWNKEWIDKKTIVNKSWTINESKKYHEIIDLLTKDQDKTKITLDIFSDTEFKELIKDKNNFEVDVNNLDSITKEDLDNDPDLQEEIKIELAKKYNLELDELLGEKDLLEKEYQSVKNNNTLDSTKKNNDLELLDIKLKRINNFIDDKNSDLSVVWDDNLDMNLLVAHKNFNDLLDKINLNDSEWARLWLEKWIILETEKWVFEITWINKEIVINSNWQIAGDSETIELKSFENKETIWYEAFFQAFKKNKAKRIQKINNFDELMWINSWNKNYELHNSKLIQKNVEFNWKKEDKDIDYLVSEKWALMKIESISDNEVEVIFWELSEWDEDDKTKKTINKISLEKSSVKLSLNEFNKIVKADKFLPDWKTGKSYKLDNIDWYNNEIKWSFSTRFWNRASIMEVYMSWKMLVEGVHEYFKKWNDVKAAEFALKWAKFLPKEVEEDFIVQTEMKSGEAMEKELSALWKISSKKAFDRILRIIKNKNSPQYKIEAWLMLSAKYGILYPKSLANYNWTFLWYEALGGKIWDKLYEEEKLKAEKSWLPFDEKELLISLLWAQSGWYLLPKRRSKFNKEFKGKIAGWYGEEYQTWYRDAEEKRNIWDINVWWLDETMNSTLPNAIWWAKKAVEKWGTLKEMNQIYFTLIFSWALYDSPWNMLEELKNHWTWEGNGMILAAFWSSLEWQKMFNNTVVNISKQIDDIEPKKYGWIASKAKELFDNSFDSSVNHKKRVGDANDFWNKYWDVLSRTLFMADWDESDSEYSKTDKLIEFWKEREHKDYYDHVKIWTPQWSAFKKSFMEDEVWPSWVTGLDNYEIIKQHFTFTASRTFRDPTVVSLVWPKIWGDIKSIKTKIENEPEKKTEYRLYLKSKLREVSAWLLSSLWKDLYDSLANSDPAWLDLASIWIDLSTFKWDRVYDILNWTWGKWDVFDNAADNVINWVFDWNNHSSKTSVFWVKDDVLWAFDDTMNYSVEDNDDNE